MGTSIRIHEDGKHAYRTDTIERAAECWDCNKTTALVKSAEFSRHADEAIQNVLAHEDLTTAQKRGTAEEFSTHYDVRVTGEIEATKD